MSDKLPWKTWLLVINIGILLTALVLMNRSFIVGYSAAIILVIGLRSGRRRVLLLWPGWVLVICALAVLVKGDSSQGRLLIYKISWSMFLENWATGIGFGNFQLLFGQYQAVYFNTAAYSQSELLLADNTYYAFNDYFQFVIETGVGGSFLLFVGLVSLLALIRSACVNVLSDKGRLLVYLSVTQILAIGSAALFTHIVERVEFQLVITFCIAVLVWYSLTGVVRYYSIAAIVVIQTGLITHHIIPAIIKSRFKDQWELARSLKAQGAHLKALHIYESVYVSLHNDADFLQDYGDLLFESGKFSHALAEFRECAKRKTSYQLCMRIATCLDANGQIEEAEEEYMKAVNMVPNRFNSRFRLFRFYIKNGFLEKARLCSIQILSMPIKIPSHQIDYIRRVVQYESAHLEL